MIPPDQSRLLPDQVIELVEERAILGMVRRDRGGVRVASRTETLSETVTATATDQRVEVTRVPVGRVVEAVEGPRVEGDVTILPVYEERIVTETRLVLVEEVHVRRLSIAREVQIPVERRRQVAEVSRLPALDAESTHPSGADIMAMTDTTTFGSRTLTALFDTSAEAERAVERLRRAGVADSAIRVTAGSETASSDYASGSFSDQHKGFWESLGDFFFPDEDRYAYAEGLSRGGNLVTVSGYDSALETEIVDILDDEGSIDLDAREGEWASSGWSGYRESDYYDPAEYDRTHRATTGTATGIGAAFAGAMERTGDAAGRAAGSVGAAVDDAFGGPGSRGTVDDDGVSDRSYQMAADASGNAFTGTRMGIDHGSDALDESGTVKVVEERMDVGKREAEGGRVRVRSYVREVPVEAEVDLRSTRVFIDRRPVDRAAGMGDVAFQDRSIEARESVEEAVVRKEARVVEEIGLRQETDTRTERVADTVRKTEVEIEDERTGETSRVTGRADTDRV